MHQFFHFSIISDLGGSLGSAGSAYSPDPNMGYLMDSSQQFRTPGKFPKTFFPFLDIFFLIKI